MSEQSIHQFIDEVCGDDRLRVDEDFGDGFVRLRLTEAEKRQAAQDIRTTEDIVIELLRNARDAHATHIFLALERVGDTRTLIMIDDGDGLPDAMFTRIFEPRVTSKLDTAHMDKWGMHGRGMALYSISVNTEQAYVKTSSPHLGTSFYIQGNLNHLGEKTDQSTFPTFDIKDDGVFYMRGPKNILRTVAEFALECKDACEVYCGSSTEIVATLYEYGRNITTPVERVHARNNPDTLPIVVRCSLAYDAQNLVEIASSLGLELSERSARRILDGQIQALDSMLVRLKQAVQPASQSITQNTNDKATSLVKLPIHDKRGLKIASGDLEHFEASIMNAFQDLADRYYLTTQESPSIRVRPEGIHIKIPFEKLE